MPEIGVRELKTRASEIIRTVRDHRARYVVTRRGRPVGVLADHAAFYFHTNPRTTETWLSTVERRAR